MIYIYLFVTGIILFHSLPARWGHGDQLVLLLTAAPVMTLAAFLVAVHTPELLRLNGTARLLLALGLGIALAAVRFLQYNTPQISRGITSQIEETLIKINGLTAACKEQKSDFALTVVAPHYRCRSGKTIYKISQKTGYNYLIFIQKKSIEMINNSGLTQQVCPALQPLPC